MSDDEREELRALRTDLAALAGRVVEIEAAFRALAELLGEARVECRAARGVHVATDDDEPPLH